MSQNYPNPFAGRTTIPFKLVGAQTVRLEVYDLLGRHVITLVDQPFASGSYEVQFDASRLSSGVYFYRLSAGEFSAVRRLVVID